MSIIMPLACIWLSTFIVTFLLYRNLSVNLYFLFIDVLVMSGLVCHLSTVIVMPVDGSQVKIKHYHCLYVASFHRIRKRGLLLGQCCSAWFLTALLLMLDTYTFSPWSSSKYTIPVLIVGVCSCTM